MSRGRCYFRVRSTGKPSSWPFQHLREAGPPWQRTPRLRKAQPARTRLPALVAPVCRPPWHVDARQLRRHRSAPEPPDARRLCRHGSTQRGPPLLRRMVTCGNCIFVAQSTCCSEGTLFCCFWQALIGNIQRSPLVM